jgi:hypothetical protein
VDGGAKTIQEIKDVGGGKLIASLKDENGNIIGLIQMPWFENSFVDMVNSLRSTLWSSEISKRSRTI